MFEKLNRFIHLPTGQSITGAGARETQPQSCSEAPIERSDIAALEVRASAAPSPEDRKPPTTRKHVPITSQPSLKATAPARRVEALAERR